MITIPKILKAISLDDYAPEFAAAVILVWVNPPRATLQEFSTLQEQASITKDADRLNEIGIRINEILSTLWSQGPEETRLSTEAVNQMAVDALETDPRFLGWLMARTWELIIQHRMAVKKN